MGSHSQPLEISINLDFTMTSTSEEPRAALLLELGRDSLLLKEIPRAVCELSEASEILSKKFGDKADECAVTLLYYGKALLELSKIVSTWMVRIKAVIKLRIL